MIRFFKKNGNGNVLKEPAMHVIDTITYSITGSRGSSPYILLLNSREI